MIRSVNILDYPQLISIWESSVLNTHIFLELEDYNYYKKHLPDYFEQVSLLGYEYENNLIGFIGTNGPNLEMLFIHNDFRGKGVGSKLISHAIEHLNVSFVEVNEQNEQAVSFYTHKGFRVVDRSELDGQGKRYPILKMKL